MKLANAEKAFSEIAALPYIFDKYPQLSPIARHIYTMLFLKWNTKQNDHTNPFQYPISEFKKDTGWDRRKIYRAKNELVEIGLISVSQSGRQATFYTLYSADEIIHSTNEVPQDTVCSTICVPQNDMQEEQNNICSTICVPQNEVCSTESVHIYKDIKDIYGLPLTPKTKKRKKGETLPIHFDDVSTKTNELLAAWEEHLRGNHPNRLPTTDNHLSAIKKAVQDRIAEYGEDGFEDIVTNSIAENRYALLGYPRKGNTRKSVQRATQKASTGYTTNGEISNYDYDELMNSLNVLDDIGGEV